MNWGDAAHDALHAARALKKHPRSCVSRAYFAAYAAITRALVDSKGVRFPHGFEGPSHKDVPNLIGNHLAGALDRGNTREIKAAIRRLYSARIDGDYWISVHVGQEAVLSALRDCHRIFRELKIEMEVSHD
jgi:uncharacterized protein (UPF0332 family)